MPRQSRIFRIASGGLESKINAFPPGSVFTVPILGKRRLRASCASLVPFRVADYTSSGFVNTAAFSTSYPAEHGPVPIVSEKEIGRIGVGRQVDPDGSLNGNSERLGDSLSLR